MATGQHVSLDCGPAVLQLSSDNCMIE